MAQKTEETCLSFGTHGMGRETQEGATAVMDMENTAHTPPAFTGITLEAILSTENLTSPLKTAQMCSNNI